MHNLKTNRKRVGGSSLENAAMGRFAEDFNPDLYNFYANIDELMNKNPKLMDDILALTKVTSAKMNKIQNIESSLTRAISIVRNSGDPDLKEKLYNIFVSYGFKDKNNDNNDKNIDLKSLLLMDDSPRPPLTTYAELYSRYRTGKQKMQNASKGVVTQLHDVQKTKENLQIVNNILDKSSSEGNQISDDEKKKVLEKLNDTIKRAKKIIGVLDVKDDKDSYDELEKRKAIKEKILELETAIIDTNDDSIQVLRDKIYSISKTLTQIFNLINEFNQLLKVKASKLQKLDESNESNKLDTKLYGDQFKKVLDELEKLKPIYNTLKDNIKNNKTDDIYQKKRNPSSTEDSSPNFKTLIDYIGEPKSNEAKIARGVLIDLSNKININEMKRDELQKIIDVLTDLPSNMYLWKNLINTNSASDTYVGGRGGRKKDWVGLLTSMITKPNRKQKGGASDQWHEGKNMKNSVVEQLSNHPFLSRDAEKVTPADRLVFVVITFFLTTISLTIVDWMLSVGYVRTTHSAMIAYITMYIVLILAIMAIIYFSSFNVNNMLYYMSVRLQRSFGRMIVHVATYLFFLPIVAIIIKIPNYQTNQNTVPSYADRKNMIRAIRWVSILMWAVASVIVAIY